MDNILTVIDIKKIYTHGRKEIRAVDGVSLGIKKGVSTAIVGPSGAGKSTLLHIMGGLDRPTSGRIVLDGADIYRLPDRERSGIRNARIGFVFQFYHLLPEFTALENVMMPALIKKYEIRNMKYEIREMAKKAMASVGLKDRVNHKPPELSGGESQRVAIARAIINSPEILLCDEPTGNLDSKARESIYELLFGLKTRLGITLVIVTHDENISLRTDITINVKDGKSL